jgi:phage terminase large subunit
MPQMITSKVFKELLQAWVNNKRRSLHEGGTSSTKTFSIIQFLILVAQQAKTPLLISVVSESLPHLKRGAIRDFFNIIDESPDNNPNWSKTEFVYSRPDWKGSIEFFGADDAGKVRGPRRDILFINEGNNVPWETARGLDIRTNRFTIVDWNPVAEFWAHEFWINQEENAYSHSTYLDAKEAGVLPESVVKDIESYKDKDPNWWNIYGLGLLGKIEGLVYPNFEQIDELPAGDRFYGLDFGFTDDPTVLVRNVIIGDCLYSDELIYETNLTNDMIARKMDLLGIRQRYDEIYADSAEPKSIQELCDKSFNVKPCEKGPGSIQYGHQKVNQYKQFWTKRSTNCIREQRSFRYIEDKDGHLTEKTTHKWSHGMDARRYAVSTKVIRIGMPSASIQDLRPSHMRSVGIQSYRGK